MTDKFIPFNPETAKNGDTVYVNKRKAYTYIGKDAFHRNASVIQNEDGYGWDENNCLTVKAPKKIVWVNLVKYGLCGIESSVFDCEKIAKGMASKYAGDYLGTFPIEIDDVA